MTPEREERLRRLAAAAAALRTAWGDARKNRDDEIDQADADGASVRAIARATGLAPTSIERILAERTAQRQAGYREAAGL